MPRQTDDKSVASHDDATGSHRIDAAKERTLGNPIWKRRQEVRENEQVNVRFIGDACRRNRARMIVGNIVKDFRSTHAAGRQSCVAKQGDQLGRQPLVNKNVRVLCGTREIFGRRRVAANDDASAFEIESVTIGRLCRVVMNADRRDREAASGKYGRGAVFVHKDRLGIKRDGIGRKHGRTVVGRTIPRIERISLIESSDHFFNAGRSVNRERFLSPGYPGLEAKFTEFANMIGVKVGDENCIDALEGNVPKQQVAC